MPSADFFHALRSAMDGEVRTDPVTRYLYSTDASIYQIQPQAVAFPRSPDDLCAAVEVAACFGVPLLARGSGSSLAGQAVGDGLILDCSRYLDKILQIDWQARTATIQPGVILADLNRQAARFGLQYGPDPASADRATMGGVIGNNASGSHSILYGMSADHLLQAEVVFSDGAVGVLGETRLDGVAGPPVFQSVLRIAKSVQTRHAALIRQNWPRVWRRASGYNLNYLLPWAAAAPPQFAGDYPPSAAPGKINLAPLLAGSEGTLAVIRSATVRLVEKPRHTLLAILAYSGVAQACDDIPRLLALRPSGIELLPRTLLELARSIPAYARMLQNALGEVLQDGIPAALLMVEFSGDSMAVLRTQASALGEDAFLAADLAHQKQIWMVRKVGLGILMSRPGDRKPVAFIEDLSVPVDQLGVFARQMTSLLAGAGTQAAFYAHASAGCLHIRPLVNLKSGQGVRLLRELAGQAVNLTLNLGGVPSGEHGDGLARSEWLERAFGDEITTLFRQVKQAADPHNLLNPGKIIDPLPMDTHLRYGQDYRAEGWPPWLDFSNQGGLAGAVEMCNGAGVCRKTQGVMCPSFQATREEMHSTRGRANLLRALLTGGLPQAEQAAWQALNLCLACKACRAECPSGVDVAKLKVEFLHHYYQSHSRPLRDGVFAHIGTLARWGGMLPGLANLGMAWLPRKWMGIAPQRHLPRLHRPPAVPPNPSAPTVIYLPDAFTRYFEPQVEAAALRMLRCAGHRVALLPLLGAGRTLISKGYLEQARRFAGRLMSALFALDPAGRLPVVGAEPSEVYTLQDEYPDLLSSDERVKPLAGRAMLLDEFLVRQPDWRAAFLPKIPPAHQTVILHGHCYQKSRPPAADGGPEGVAATIVLLENAGVQVDLIESGCCGMAGAFGYQDDTYSVSMQVGEQSLFPALRAAPPDAVVLAVGTSCRTQIQDGAGRVARHPLVWLDEVLRGE